MVFDGLLLFYHRTVRSPFLLPNGSILLRTALITLPNVCLHSPHALVRIMLEQIGNDALYLGLFHELAALVKARGGRLGRSYLIVNLDGADCYGALGSLLTI